MLVRAILMLEILLHCPPLTGRILRAVEFFVLVFSKGVSDHLDMHMADLVCMNVRR